VGEEEANISKKANKVDGKGRLESPLSTTVQQSKKRPKSPSIKPQKY
jgi:hypothetical protein